MSESAAPVAPIPVVGRALRLNLDVAVKMSLAVKTEGESVLGLEHPSTPAID